MDTYTKRGYVILFAILLFTVLTGYVCYNIGSKTTSTGGRVGTELERAIEVNRELRDEQRRELERNREVTATVERLRRINQETNSALRELRDVTGRLYTIPERIRKEADLLDDYFGRTSSELDNYFDNNGSE